MAAYNPIVERYRIHADAAADHLTYSVVEWLPVFVSHASCQIAEVIRRERFWGQKLDYLLHHPCVKGLVLSPERWRYSLAGWHASGDSQPVDVPLTHIQW